MLEIENHGYYPLTAVSVEHYAPSRPGIYMLAMELPNGVRQTIHNSQAENIHRSLLKLIEEDMLPLPVLIRDSARRHRCCFTYYVIVRAALREEVQKMLAQTSDPVLRLRVVNVN